MERAKKKSFYPTLLVAAIDNFGFSIVVVLFAPLIFYSNSPLLPADTSTAMRSVYLAILLVAFPLTQFFGSPFLGSLADQIGRKKALCFSIAGTIVGFILSGVAISLSSINWLIFSRLLTGFFAGNLAICLSIIADLSPSETSRSRNMGTLMVTSSLSWTVAMLVGGYLSDASKCSLFSESLPFWITSLLAAASFCVVVKYYQETHQPKQNSRFHFKQIFHDIQLSLKSKKTRPLFFVLFIWALGWGIAIQWFATYSILVYQASKEAISWGLLIQGLFWLTGGALLNPYLLKRFKSITIALLGFTGSTFFLILASIHGGYLFFVFLFSIAASFSSLALINGVNVVSLYAPEEIQGETMGLSQSMLSLGGMIVPLMGGYIGASNTRLFYPLSALLLSLAVLCLLIASKPRKSWINN